MRKLTPSLVYGMIFTVLMIVMIESQIFWRLLPVPDNVLNSGRILYNPYLVTALACVLGIVAVYRDTWILYVLPTIFCALFLLYVFAPAVAGKPFLGDIVFAMIFAGGAIAAWGRWMLWLFIRYDRALKDAG